MDAQTKAEIDELISFVRKSDVRFIRNGEEYSAPTGPIICGTNSPGRVTG